MSAGNWSRHTEALPRENKLCSDTLPQDEEKLEAQCMWQLVCRSHSRSRKSGKAGQAIFCDRCLDKSRVHLPAHHTATATYVNLQPHKTLLALPATLSQDHFYEKVRRYAYWRYRMCFNLWEIFLEALSKQVVHAARMEVAAKLSVCKGQAYLLSSSSLSTCLVCRIFIWYHLSSAIAGEEVNLVSNIWFYNHSTSMNTFTHYNNHACTTKASSHYHLTTHTKARTRGIISRTYSYPLFVLYPKQNKI